MVRYYLIFFVLFVNLCCSQNTNLLVQEDLRFNFLKSYFIGENKSAINYFDRLVYKSIEDSIKYLRLLSRENRIIDYNKAIVSFIERYNYIDLVDFKPLIDDSISCNKNYLLDKIICKNRIYQSLLKEPKVAKLLDTIWFIDQKIREDFINEISKNGYSNYFLKLNDSMRIIDSININKLIEFKVFNGLNLSELSIGKKGLEVVFLVVQHSGSIEQREYLLKNCKDLSTMQYMLLEDRISVMKSNKQIYGTQYDADNKLIPIIDVETCNQYRIKNNLITIEHVIELNKLR